MQLLGRLQSTLAGRYEIVREIGRGGMASVFLARDLSRGGDVAVKALRPELSLAIGPNRFLREIRILSQLDHPNILPLLDSGDMGALLYYVMAFARQGTLRARLNTKHRFLLPEVVSVASEVGAALDHAHARGIIHRDVKPENILFDDGQARVCDFGVARALEVSAGEELSSSGILIGTPSYMSPEQTCAGATLDGLTDVYALGCVVYEMLAGEPPFSGATPQAVFAGHRSKPPSSLRVLRPDLPAHADAAVLAALAKEPEARPQSAGEFVNRLRHV